jgi:hypothetical protein
VIFQYGAGYSANVSGSATEGPPVGARVRARCTPQESTAQPKIDLCLVETFLKEADVDPETRGWSETHRSRLHFGTFRTPRRIGRSFITAFDLEIELIRNGNGAAWNRSSCVCQRNELVRDNLPFRWTWQSGLERTTPFQDANQTLRLELEFWIL